MASSSDQKEGAVIVDDELTELRKKRLAFLKQKEEENLRAIKAGGGKLREIEESEFLPIVTTTKWVMASFYHRNFHRCEILHQHLEKLARKYPAIAFLKIDVEKASFFVNKLKIRILPVLLFFKDGINTSRCVGFEDFGNRDDFPTVFIEERMEKEGMIILDPSATDELLEAHKCVKESKPFKTGSVVSSGVTGSQFNSSSISTREDEYERMRQELMNQDDEDLFN